MAATSVGISGAVLTAGAAAQSVELTGLMREVLVTNLHATQYLCLTVAEGTFAGNPAVTAVVDADDVIIVPPNSKVIVWRNVHGKRALNLNIIASGATTKCYVEGRNWFL